jgi:Tfp pilus assembly protein PilO
MNADEYFDELYGHVISEISHFKDEEEKTDEERSPLAYNLEDIRSQLVEQMEIYAELERTIPDYTKVGM